MPSELLSPIRSFSSPRRVQRRLLPEERSAILAILDVTFIFAASRTRIPPTYLRDVPPNRIPASQLSAASPPRKLVSGSVQPLINSSSCNFKAKQYLSRGQKTLALEQLRTKRLAEEGLTRSLGVMSQLRTVVQNIDQAKSDIEVSV